MKWLTDKENRLQYVSDRTLATLLAFVNKQISTIDNNNYDKILFNTLIFLNQYAYHINMKFAGGSKRREHTQKLHV